VNNWFVCFWWLLELIWLILREGIHWSADQVWGTVFLQAGREFTSSLSTLHLHFLKGTLGVKRFTTNWAVLQKCGHEPLQFYWFWSAVKLFDSMLIPTVSLCRGWYRLISILSLVQAPAGPLNCWALIKDCVGASHMYELSKLDVLFLSKSLLRIWSIGWEVFGETLSWWTLTCTTTNRPLIILGLPPLFLEMSVCRLLYHGISILICPNMLCAMPVDSTCVRIL